MFSLSRHNNRLPRAAMMSLTTVAMTAFLGCAQSNISSNVYRASNIDDYAAKRIVIMPLIVTAGSLTEVSTSYAPDWILETHTTMALSPAEYLPTEQVVLSGLAGAIGNVDWISPREV